MLKSALPLLLCSLALPSFAQDLSAFEKQQLPNLLRNLQIPPHAS